MPERNDHPSSVFLQKEDSNKSENNQDIDKQYNLFSQAKNITRSLDLYPTAIPAITLYVYNRLSRFPIPSKEHKEKILQAAKVISAQEEKAAHNDNPLPTVGIELEFPQDAIKPLQGELLDSMACIPNTTAYMDISDAPLWEIRPDFTYSGVTQAILLAETAKYLSLITHPEKQIKVIAYANQTSLHLNFGIPYSDRRLKEEKIYALSDGITYAYTDPERILRRKTMSSIYMHKFAESSSKSASNLSKDKRLEIRPSHFKDGQTYRMIMEAQLLAAGLFADRKMNFFSDRQQKALTTIWNSYEAQMSRLTKQFSLAPNSVDLERVLVAKVLNTTDLPTKAKQVMQEHAKEIQEEISPSQE